MVDHATDSRPFIKWFWKDLHFHALEDNGTLSIFLRFENVKVRFLIIVAFVHCSNYSIFTERRRNPRQSPVSWIRVIDDRYLIRVSNRLLDVYSASPPAIRVLGGPPFLNRNVNLNQ